MVREFDYKSGKLALIFRHLSWIELQLAIYLNAAIEYMKKLTGQKNFLQGFYIIT